MKKLILAVFIMFIGTTSFSQGLNIDLGVKGGINFSNIRNLPSLNLKYKKGLQAGVFAGITFSDKFGVQADILFSELGAEINRAGANFDLNYITVPVVFKYYLVAEEGFNIQIGPQYGYLLDSELKATIGDEDISTEATQSDLSGVFGVGYDLPYGIRLDARYHLGFTDVTGDLKANGRLKYVTITAGFSFL
ncbi:porin family protein [Aequorivita marina]|uniref:porin family protein n=1 Tax=Aequorivita marina TaxID=3073654 RepID=UPI002876CAF5|nr:porin family protein [Aequorivita sp. S2608]MDS1297536.1 porin family protein [Aequorivita sp. S2608]